MNRGTGMRYVYVVRRQESRGEHRCMYDGDDGNNNNNNIRLVRRSSYTATYPLLQVVAHTTLVTRKHNKHVTCTRTHTPTLTHTRRPKRYNMHRVLE